MMCVSKPPSFSLPSFSMTVFSEKGMISAPLNVRHVGTADVLEQLQAQSKFPVEVGLYLCNIHVHTTVAQYVHLDFTYQWLQAAIFLWYGCCTYTKSYT